MSKKNTGEMQENYKIITTKLKKFKTPYFKLDMYVYTGSLISLSGISGLCSTVVGIVTPKDSMSTEGETLQFSVLSYSCSIRPLLVTRHMSIL